MLKRFLIFFLISVTALNGMYTPSPVDAQDATPVPGESQVEDQSTPDTVPSATSAPTETLPATEQPETDSNQNVQAQDDDDVGPVVSISLTTNGESTSLVVPINSSVVLNATGPWEASEGSLHFNVYPDSTCSGNVDIDNAPDYSASGSATYTWRVTFDGTFFVRLAWVTDEDVFFSNCVQIDVTVPIALTANGQASSLEVPVNADIVLTATGPWEASQQVNSDIYFNLYADSTCAVLNDVRVYNLPADGPATDTWRVASVGTYSFNFTWRLQRQDGDDRYSSNCVQVNVIDAPLLLTANGSQAQVNVTYPVSIPLQASSASWAGAGEWSNADIDADIYVFSGTSCSSNDPTYIPLNGVNSIATSTFQPPATGDYSLQVWWFPGPTLSNCLDIHVTAPVITLTSNGSQDPVNVTYPDSVPLQASSASWAGVGEWSNADIDADIYVFPGSSCTSNDPTYIPLNGVDSIATATFLPPTTGDYSLQVWWFPGPSLSNCLDVHVVSPVITLTSNGSKDPVNASYPVTVPLNVTGPWDQYDNQEQELLDLNLNVYRGTSCSGEIAQTVPVQVIDGIAATRAGSE